MNRICFGIASMNSESEDDGYERHWVRVNGV